MPKISFTRNDSPTIGVELELQLVDKRTMALSNSIEPILARLSPALAKQVKPELMQCYIEINTGICRTVREARDDLRNKLEDLTRVTDGLGLDLFWAATHPFSSWRDQQITVNDRYFRLVELMQDVARQLVSFGLHVHIGVDTGDKAVMVCDRMLRHLPLLLALSANSPFWEGRWSEYTWLINHLVDTGFINTIREIWWDIRPHHNFGTVEIRVCDMPANLAQVSSIAAVVQCLVHAISNEIDEGTYQSEYHPMMVQQNKWRATRFGPDARLVNTNDYKQYSVQETIDALIALLLPTARKLGCVEELTAASRLPATTGSRQQLEIFEKTGDGAAVVREMLARNDWRKDPAEPK